MDINTTVYKLPIVPSISNFSSDFDSFAETVAKAFKTICTITALTLYCLDLSCQIHVLINLFLLFFFNMMIHWDRKIHNLPRVQSLPHLAYYNLFPYQSSLVCPSRLLLSHHLSMLQHWVHGCTTYFL